MVPTEMFGLPVRPCALVAVVAVVAVVADVALPLNAPSKVVAVATPVITAPLGNSGAPVSAYQQFYRSSNSGHPSRIFLVLRHVGHQELS